MTVHKLPRTTRFLHFILSFLADILIRYPQNGQSSEHFVSFNVIECLLPPSVLTNEYGVITSKIGLDPIKARSHTTLHKNIECNIHKISTITLNTVHSQRIKMQYLNLFIPFITEILNVMR